MEAASIPANVSADLILGRPTYAELTQSVLRPIGRASRGWWILFGISGIGVAILILAIIDTVGVGIGVFGTNIPVAWAYPIIDFVWWIGIGHAGTFISAFLVLMGERWRASINRVAEAMTIFALVQAGLFPILHLGRPWFAYWLIPYPATMGVWPQFKSTLPWDVAAVTTYFTVSLLFWYVGMIPDLATVRDRASGLTRRRIYGILALGWRGSEREWQQYRSAYVLLAAFATPLVISVHSIISLDFAFALLPGWHSTIFPPYFVVGAIYSGLAMVACLLIPIRHAYGFERIITARHLENLAKLMLACAWMMAYSYALESFIGWYSADRFERYTYLWYRPFGEYGWIFWTLLFTNCLAPQAFWSKRLRRSEPVLWAVGLLIVIGMWLERFDLIVTAEARDFLPSSWHFYAPSLVDWALLFGTISLFLFLYLLFLRWAPVIPLHEVKRLRRELDAGERAAGREGGTPDDRRTSGNSDAPAAEGYGNREDVGRPPSPNPALPPSDRDGPDA